MYVNELVYFGLCTMLRPAYFSAHNVLGSENKGVLVLMSGLDIERGVAGAGALGLYFIDIWIVFYGFF